MSLVPTFAQAQDGQWYKNPVLGDDSNEWFVCYDDDEPIEVVVKEEAEITVVDVVDKLRRAGYDLRIISKPVRGGRFFGKDIRCHSEKAASCFLKPIHGAPPVDLIIRHDGVFTDVPNADCVYYKRLQ